MKNIIRTLVCTAAILTTAVVAKGQVEPNDTYYDNNQWGLWNGVPGIQAPGAWSLYTGSDNNVKIYISDTGILTRDFNNTYWDVLKHADLRSDNYVSNYLDYYAPPGYFRGHGTFVSGIVGAVTNNNRGVAGVNWNTSVNQVSGPTSGIPGAVAGINTAISHGAEVLNMSWGVDYDLDLVKACANAYKSNMLLIAATGNEQETSLNKYPAKLPWVMAVGATDNSGAHAFWYSNYGQGISVVAPGGFKADQSQSINIFSTGVNYWTQEVEISPGVWITRQYLRENYCWAGGTSAAAPFVTGVAGLVKGYAKTRGINLSNDDLRNIIELSADDIDLPGYDVKTGYGKINAKRAMEYVSPSHCIFQWSASGGYTQSVSGLIDMYFANVPGLSDGWYWAYKYEIRKSITFPTNYSFNVIPTVWGRGVGSNGYCAPWYNYYNYGIPFTEIVPGSITSSGCQIRTYVYKVYQGTSFKGWFPFENPANAIFQYTALIPYTAPNNASISGYYEPYSEQKVPAGFVNLIWGCTQGTIQAKYTLQIMEPYSPNGTWTTMFTTTTTSYRYQHQPHSSGTGYRIISNDGKTQVPSNVVIIKPEVPGDPVVATVTSPEATAYSNGKKIVIDDAGALHVTYVSEDTVFYTNSYDEGETWPEKTVIGFGSNPAIELLGDGQPSICFLSENHLYRANRLSSGWEPAHCLYEGQKADHFTYLSYIVDQERDKSYLGWVSTNLSDYSELLILPLEENNGKAFSEPVRLDHANNPDAFKSPSLALEREGELLIAWSRNGVVKYSVSMGEPEIISDPDKHCIHPIIYRQGDRISAIWQEEILDNGKGLEPGRFLITARTKTEYGWNGEKIIACSETGDYQYPVAVAAGQYLYAGQHGDGNYDVHYLGDYSNGWETYSRNITLNSGGQSGYPSAAFSNRWPEHALYILWTEAFTDSSQGKSIEPPLVKAFKDVIQPVPSFEVYPRTDQASTYCIQRAGGLCYGAGAFMTADYHPEALIYRFDGLRPGNRYKVKAVFYQASVANPEDKAKDWLQMLKCDQTTLGLAHVPKGEAVVLEKEIPSHCLADGVVEIAILRVKGVNAVCSGLEIIEYTDGDKADGGGAQSAESELLPATYRTELLPCAPNPFDRSTTIRYQLAKPGKVSIKVYNTLGQLVRTLEDGERLAGYHSVIWNGKDQSGKVVANGIYLYRMEIGEYGQTRKMTLVR